MLLPTNSTHRDAEDTTPTTDENAAAMSTTTAMVSDDLEPEEATLSYILGTVQAVHLLI